MMVCKWYLDILVETHLILNIKTDGIWTIQIISYYLHILKAWHKKKNYAI